jgi:competence protein ComEC
MFSRSKVFLIACLVFISGIAAASFLPAEFLSSSKIWWFSAAIFFLALTALFWLNVGAENFALLRLGFLFLAILFLAVWRYATSLPVEAPDKIWHYNNQTVMLRGFVAGEPDVRETSQKLEIATGGICLDNLGRDKPCPYRRISGKLLVTTGLYPEYNYGDKLAMTCELKSPEQFNGFAYDRYLARYDIYSTCYWPLSPSASGTTNAAHANIIYRKIFSFKKILTGLIDAGMSEPESSLARPIVFGGQRGLPQSIRDDFQKVGLTHIMAVSGFNVSILSTMVMAMLLAMGMSRRRAFYLATAVLVAYVILVGLPASALRAGLMCFLVLWALKLGRLNKMTNSLVLAAATLLLINPKLLRDDVGFQLSFLAVAGLVYVYPLLEAFWQKIIKAGAIRGLPLAKGLSDALLITLAAQILTLPLLAYNFSRISLIAPLVNLAVLWTVPILTVLILLALPLSFILPGLSFVFFLPSLIISKYILAAVRFFASLPHGSLEIAYLSWGWAVLYYALVILIIIKLRHKLLKLGRGGKI